MTPTLLETANEARSVVLDRILCECRACASFPPVLPREHNQILYDQEVDTLNQAHEEQREEEKQNSEQKMNEVQVRINK